MNKKEIEGKYGTWAWNDAGKCYQLIIYAKIYPMDDGRYVTSYSGVWNTPADIIIDNFEDAEKASLGIS